MSPGGKVKKSGLPYLIGSSTSGVLEIALFHPVDTVAKRLMSSQKSVFLAGGKGIDTTVLSSIIFKENVGKGVFTKLYGLFPGASFGVVYKVLQRTYKWGGQPLAKGAMDVRFGEAYRNAFGKKNGNDLMHASAGALIGAGEVFLLPLDVLKIKMQVNPEALAGRGVIDIFKNEGFALYRGWNWTIARNMPGSFALFGANSLSTHGSLAQEVPKIPLLAKFLPRRCSEAFALYPSRAPWTLSKLGSRTRRSMTQGAGRR